MARLNQALTILPSAVPVMKQALRPRQKRLINPTIGQEAVLIAYESGFNHKLS